MVMTAYDFRTCFKMYTTGLYGEETSNVRLQYTLDREQTEECRVDRNRLSIISDLTFTKIHNDD